MKLKHFWLVLINPKIIKEEIPRQALIIGSFLLFVGFLLLWVSLVFAERDLENVLTNFILSIIATIIVILIIFLIIAIQKLLRSPIEIRKMYYTACLVNFDLFLLTSILNFVLPETADRLTRMLDFVFLFVMIGSTNEVAEIPKTKRWIVYTLGLGLVIGLIVIFAIIAALTIFPIGL